MDRKYYELTYSQRTLLYAQKYTVHKQINNVAILVLTDQKLDQDNVSESIRIAIKRNDCFNIRFTDVGGETKQYFTEYQEPRIGKLDFKGQTREKMDSRLYDIAKKRVTKNDKPLYQIYTVCSNEEKSGIFLVISHMIMDSWAISTFFKDVMAIYSEIINGSNDMLKPLYPYEELLKEELNYRNTPDYKRDREYYERLFEEESEPFFTHVNGSEFLNKYRAKKGDSNIRYACIFNLKSKADNIMFPISKELTDKMNKYCGDNKISMQALVLLVYMSFLSKVNESNDVSIYTVVARRGSLKEKNTGGTRVHFYPFRTVFERETAVSEACEKISQQQSTIYRHANIDPLEVMQISKKAYDVPQEGTHVFSSLTFQPVKLKVDGMNIDTKWYGNGATSNALYLTIMDGDSKGGLKVYYEYQTNVISNKTIENLHTYLLKGIERCLDEGVTVGDLLDLGDSSFCPV